MEQTERNKRRYDQMVKAASPPSHVIVNCVRAFLSGGVICLIGQAFINIFKARGATVDDAGLLAAITLIVLSILLTGLGLYEKIGKHAGAGSVVPITGFANAIAAPAIEFKKEGLVLGVGAKMFVIAGPVIVYGTMASVLVGLVYYFIK